MIAVAAATLLTLTALTIWSVRTVRRPIDWDLTPPDITLELLAADISRLMDQIDRHIWSTEPVDSMLPPDTAARIEAHRETFQAAFDPSIEQALNLSDRAAFGQAHAIVSEQGIKALRASERHDHEREDR